MPTKTKEHTAKVKGSSPVEKRTKQVLKNALNDPLNSMRRLIMDDLHMFIRFFWEEYSTDEFVDNWHLREICKELEIIARRIGKREKKLYDLIINVPPGTTKTGMVSIFFPVWCWVNWYWIRFITGSYSAALSLESAEYSRDIVRSEKFKMMFPGLEIRQDKDTKSNFRVIKKEYVSPGRVPRVKQGGGRVSTSVGGSILGFHGHILIPDDPLNPEQSISELGLQKANRWVDRTLSTRKTDKEVSVMILIMQRLHENDPTGHLLKKKGRNIKHICLPGEIRNYKEYVKPKEWLKFYKDDLFDTKRMTWDILKELESDLGQYGYAGQIGQNPTPAAGGMFKVDNFRYIDKVPSYDNIVKTVRYWDKAGSEGKGAFTVGVKIHLLKNKTYVVADVVRGQWSSEKRERIILQTAELDKMIQDENPVNPPVETYIEQEPGSGGKESADATIRNLAGFIVTADRPTGDKTYRADPYSVQVNNGNVLLVKGEWNKTYVEELRFFPYSTYKDQTDASSGAFSKLTARKVAGNPFKKNRK